MIDRRPGGTAVSNLSGSGALGGREFVICGAYGYAELVAQAHFSQRVKHAVLCIT